MAEDYTGDFGESKPNAMDFLDTIKLNLFSHEIFVFTPKGDIKTMPQGATALDFAYDIHSDIGDKCIGAKVNYKLVPISHTLTSGDQIEILTSKTQHPKEEWLGFVTTAKARNKLEYALRRMTRDAIKLGEEALIKSFKDSPYELNDLVISQLLDYYNYANKDDFYFAIGNHEIDLPLRMEKLLLAKKDSDNNLFVRYMKQAYNAVLKTEKKDDTDTKRQDEAKVYDKINPKGTYILDQDSFKNNFSLSPCCTPVAGDKVFGSLRQDSNIVEVHAINCLLGQRLKANYGDNIVNLEWNADSKLKTQGTLIIRGIDRVGILNDISKLIAENMSINIKSINLDTNDGVFEANLTLFVNDVSDIHTLSSLLMKIDGVKAVNRVF